MATAYMQCEQQVKPAFDGQITNCVRRIQSLWSHDERERRAAMGRIRRRELYLLLGVLGSGAQPQ